jgi:hypothetical protein
MSITRHASPEEAKRYDHGVNIGSVYTRVANARWTEMFRGELPDDSLLSDWQKTLDRLTPPVPAVAKKHARAAHQIARWRRLASLPASLQAQG